MLLMRVADSGLATYSVLLQGRVPFAVSLERSWKNNERGVSCIPAGVFECARVKSPKFGDTFQVMNVPGRQEILFHKGNIEDDSHGCILIGKAFNPVLGKPGITGSAEGFAEFMSLTRMTDRFPLIIVDAAHLLGFNDPVKAPNA